MRRSGKSGEKETSEAKGSFNEIDEATVQASPDATTVSSELQASVYIPQAESPTTKSP